MPELDEQTQEKKSRSVDTIGLHRIFHILPTYSRQKSKIKVIKPARPAKKWKRIAAYSLSGLAVLLLLVFALSSTRLFRYAKLIYLMKGANYIIGFQNSAELRPTGGFWGSFAYLKTGAKLTDSELVFETNPYKNSNAILQDSTVSAPKPMQEIFGNTPQSFVNANWSLDYPEAAKTIEWYFGQGWSQKSDGVVAVSSLAMIDLLKLTGPVQASDGTILTSDNFTQMMSQKIDIEYWQNDANKQINEPKTIIKELAPQIITKAKTISKLKLLRFLNEQVSEGRVLVYFNNPKLQKQAESLGLSGKLAPYGIDYLMVNNANLGGGKSSLNVNQSISYWINSVDDKPTAELKVTRSVNNDWPNELNRNYMRVAVPTGTKLVSAFDENSNIKSKVDISTESGRTTFGFWASVSPNESKTFTLVYELPFKNDALDRYNLVIQKQSGTNPDELKVKLKDKTLFKGTLNEQEKTID